MTCAAGFSGGCRKRASNGPCGRPTPERREKARPCRGRRTGGAERKRTAAPCGTAVLSCRHIACPPSGGWRQTRNPPPDKKPVADLFGEEVLDGLGEARQIRLGDLSVRAHAFPLGPQGLGDEGGEQDDRHVAHARIVTDVRRQAVPVHIRHLDIRNDQLDLVGHSVLRPGELIPQAAQIFPGFVAVGLVRHAEARLLQRGTDDVPQGGGVVHYQQVIMSRALDGRGVHLHMAHVQRGVEAGEDLFHVQHEEDAVVDAQHACHALPRIVVDIGIGRFHPVPGQAMDARHRRDKEGRLHPAKFRHQHLVGLALHETLAEPCRQIHQRQHPPAQIERPQGRAVAVPGHVGDARQPDDLQHFGDVDAVMPRIGRTVGQFFREEEFDDLQLVVPGFKQADLAHVKDPSGKALLANLIVRFTGSLMAARQIPPPAKARRQGVSGRRPVRVPPATVPAGDRRRPARRRRSGGSGHGRHPVRTRPCGD